MKGGGAVLIVGVVLNGGVIEGTLREGVRFIRVRVSYELGLY